MIYDKHPLSNYAKVQKVFIDGQMYFDRDKDMSERAVKAERKKALMEKQKAAAAPAPGAGRPAGAGRRPQ